MKWAKRVQRSQTKILAGMIDPRPNKVSQEALTSMLNRQSPVPLHRRLASYSLLHGITAVVLLLDQLSKVWIRNHIPFGTWTPPGAIEIIPNFFYLTHVGNTGAAWSMLSGKSVLLACIATLTLGAIFFYRKTLALKMRSTQIAFGLLIGGIIGNLIDRIAYGHVVDFLDFHFGSYVYPTFNIADSGICVGVAIYLWVNFSAGKPSK